MRHKKTPIIIYDHHGHHQPRFLPLGSADGALDAFGMLDTLGSADGALDALGMLDALGSTDGALDMLGTFDTDGNAASTPPLGLKLDDRMLDELGSADRVGYAEGALLALGIDVSDGIEVGNGDALGSIPSVSLRGNVISPVQVTKSNFSFVGSRVKKLFK